MVGWHHRLNGHEFEPTLGDAEGQESLECRSLWSCRVGRTEQRQHSISSRLAVIQIIPHNTNNILCKHKTSGLSKPVHSLSKVITVPSDKMLPWGQVPAECSWRVQLPSRSFRREWSQYHSAHRLAHITQVCVCRNTSLHSQKDAGSTEINRSVSSRGSGVGYPGWALPCHLEAWVKGSVTNGGSCELYHTDTTFGHTA